MIPPQAQAWRLPASPRGAVVVARGAVLAMASLALLWWLTLAWDAAQGRETARSVAVAGMLVAVWAVMAWRWATSLRPQTERCLYWVPRGTRHDGDARVARKPAMPSRWLDERGVALDVRVVMDAGAGVLLRWQASPEPGAPRVPAEWRWVGAEDLEGPWRWRAKTSGRHHPQPADEKPEQPMVASWALRASRKAPLPKSSRRSA